MLDKPPYFPFYVRDFVSDGKVEAMTTQEVGAYILLLAKAWFEEPAGSLPNNDSVLARWARLDAVAWAECRPKVLLCFVLGADDRWHQKRMRQEYARAKASLKARSKAGKKGAHKRWHSKDLGEVDCQSHSDANGETMPTGYGVYSSLDSPEEKKHTPKGGAGGGDFAAFWTAYPRKQAKKDALAAWKKIAPDAVLLAVMLAALERQKQTDQWRRGIYPHPSTWLNGRRWEDEGVQAQTQAMPPTLEQLAEKNNANRKRVEEQTKDAVKPPPGFGKQPSKEDPDDIKF